MFAIDECLATIEIKIRRLFESIKWRDQSKSSTKYRGRYVQESHTFLDGEIDILKTAHLKRLLEKLPSNDFKIWRVLAFVLHPRQIGISKG